MLEKVAHDNGMSVAEDVTIGLIHPLGQGLKSSVIPLCSLSKTLVGSRVRSQKPGSGVCLTRVFEGR